MANKRLSMRNIEEVLRLYFHLGRSRREIAKSMGVSPTTVADYVQRATAANLSWPLPADLSASSLEALLFPPTPASSVKRPEPDWGHIQNELRRPGVTLNLLWSEYKDSHPDGLQYSAFCDNYRRWLRKLTPTMRQHHQPGEKLFVDYSGKRPVVVDPQTGKVATAELFVAVMGASNYTYAEATWSQGMADWIGAHERALKYFNALPLVVVPDNLKSAVIKADFYAPTLNSAYRDWASHHGITIIPTRTAKPRDKAKVEAGVLLVQRWILAALRDQRFFSLRDLNEAIHGLLTKLNNRRFKKMEGSRASVFESQERPVMRPLTDIPYEFCTWKNCRVNLDYHVEVLGHYYSVPFELVRETVDARITEMMVELYFKGQRVASHPRSTGNSRFSTQQEHMPANHRAAAGWQPEISLQQARRIGPHTASVLEVLIGQRQHMMQAFKSCTGVLNLARKYGPQRLEKACEYALLRIPKISRASLVSILDNGMERQLAHDYAAQKRESLPSEHTNVRGPAYYH